MKTRRASWLIVLTVLYLAVAQNESRGQYAVGPTFVPQAQTASLPMATGGAYGYGPSSYAPSPYAPSPYAPSGFAPGSPMVAPASYYVGDAPQAVEQAPCSDCEGGCSECNAYDGSGWFDQNHHGGGLGAGLGAILGFLRPYGAGGCCAPHWWDVEGEAVFLKRADSDDPFWEFSRLGAKGPAVITSDDVALDWMIANYLQDPSVGDGQYAYANYPNAPKAYATETIDECPSEGQYSVHQYGADYIEITCAGNTTLTFTGSTVVELLPADAHSGSYAFWSNKGDESDMTLTREFDLAEVQNATLSYWTWYDLEEDYDYLYVEASTDGEHWDILLCNTN